MKYIPHFPFQRPNGEKRKGMKAFFYIMAGSMIGFLLFVDPASAVLMAAGSYLYLR